MVVNVMTGEPVAVPEKNVFLPKWTPGIEPTQGEAYKILVLEENIQAF